MSHFHHARAACAGLLGPAVMCLAMGVREPAYLGVGAVLLALGLGALARTRRA